MPLITYRKRRKYKYTLQGDLFLQTTIYPNCDVLSAGGLLTMRENGALSIHKGYSWDGPSGPTIDTKSFMRGSLVHDALYQLMREGRLPIDSREKADVLLVKICRQDGMSLIRSKWVYAAVRKFGESSATSDLLFAP